MHPRTSDKSLLAFIRLCKHTHFAITMFSTSTSQQFPPLATIVEHHDNGCFFMLLYWTQRHNCRGTIVPEPVPSHCWRLFVCASTLISLLRCFQHLRVSSFHQHPIKVEHSTYLAFCFAWVLCSIAGWRGYCFWLGFNFLLQKKISVVEYL